MSGKVIATGYTKDGDAIESREWAGLICAFCAERLACLPIFKTNFVGHETGGQTWELSVSGEGVGSEECEFEKRRVN